MSLVKYKRIAAAAAIATIPLFLAGCGGSNPSNVPGVGVVNGALTPGAPGTCIPINQQIPFTLNNIYFDWANILGGAIPMSSTSVGQVLIGGAPVTGPSPLFRNGSDGTIVLNINPTTGQYGGYPYPSYPQGTVPVPGQYPTQPFGTQTSTVTGTGYIQINQLAQQDIMYRVQDGEIQLGNLLGPSSGYPAPAGYPYQTPGYGFGVQPAQLCVSQIAINVGHYNNTIYGGIVYLYLNGSQHGYKMFF